MHSISLFEINFRGLWAKFKRQLQGKELAPVNCNMPHSEHGPCLKTVERVAGAHIQACTFIALASLTPKDMHFFLRHNRTKGKRHTARESALLPTFTRACRAQGRNHLVSTPCRAIATVHTRRTDRQAGRQAGKQTGGQRETMETT